MGRCAVGIPTGEYENCGCVCPDDQCAVGSECVARNATTIAASKMDAALVEQPMSPRVSTSVVGMCVLMTAVTAVAVQSARRARGVTTVEDDYVSLSDTML